MCRSTFFVSAGGGGVVSVSLVLAAVLAAGGCSSPGPAVPSDVPATVEGANRTMEQATVNGFEATKLECKTSGGLMAGMGILGGLAQQQEALAACSAQAETVRTYFDFDGKKTGDVRVADASTPSVARCVADAVAAAVFPDPCTCVVSFKIGPATP